MKRVTLYALKGVPLIQQGDDIGAIICETAVKNRFPFTDGDIVVVASKIVSKAESRLVDTDFIKPSKKALSLSRETGIAATTLELILRETKRVLIARSNLFLTEHRLGFICTKAGVDSSNTEIGPKGKIVALLPKDPDSSARKIRRTIKHKTDRNVAVIINDTFGRPDRLGSVGMAIGIAGISAVFVPAIQEDIHGKKRHPEISQVDELAAAASLLMGQTNERRPVIIVKGVDYQVSEKDCVQNLLHPISKYFEDAAEIVRRNRRISN